MATAAKFVQPDVQITFGILKMAAVAMEMAILLKIEKHKNDHSRLLAKQKLMTLDRNNIHI
jgi:hypothetical protein